jgi:mediator of RNA polymerase II transcription subunit 7
MAAPPAPLPASHFPDPPPFYKLYAGGAASGPPPPPPAAPPFAVFGVERPADEPLVPPLAVSQLYACRPDGSVDRKAALASLSRDLLFLYTELAATLAEAPAEHAPLLTRLNQGLLNAQHLVNGLRPHQARATLEGLLAAAIAARRAALADVRAQVGAADALLASAASALAAVDRELSEAAAAPGRPAERMEEG